MFRAAQLNDAEWDSALDGVVVWSGADIPVGVWSPYNYSGWARMKALDGWSFLRVTDDDGLPVAQVLLKRRGPVVVAYAPGGFASATRMNARVRGFPASRTGCRSSVCAGAHEHPEKVLDYRHAEPGVEPGR